MEVGRHGFRIGVSLLFFLRSEHQAKEGPASKETITFKDFQRMDLRVAEVIRAERVEGADKLLQLQVDLGDEMRTIVAGIAQEYAPEDLIGRKIVVIANLEPARIRGIESKGMLLAAGGEAVLALVTLDRDAPAGTVVR